MRSMIEEIRDAEKQAEEIRAQAVSDSRDMVGKARVDAEAAIAAAAEAERQKTRDALIQAEKDGVLLSEQVLSREREGIKEQESSARSKMDKAVAYLVERIEALV